MVALLGRIVSVLIGIAEGVCAGIIQAVNLMVVAMAALVALAWSLLPGMPDPPNDLDSRVLEFINWLLPLGGMFALFSVWVAAWVTFTTIRVLLKRVGII